uniref:Uncharacterized protein n=1 Tax=Anopheles farauti TaxID=69004 RepID=A0A182QPQ9_9DIPT
MPPFVFFTKARHFPPPLTLCIRFCALPTSISVASRSSSEPCAPSIVAFTVDRIFSCVPIVGMRSHTCSSRVTSSDASAICFAVAISSRLLPFESARTSSDNRAISTAIRLAAAMISLSFDDHWRTSWWSPWAAIRIGWFACGILPAWNTSSSSSVSATAGGGGRIGGMFSRGSGGRGGGTTSFADGPRCSCPRSGISGTVGACVTAPRTFRTLCSNARFASRQLEAAIGSLMLVETFFASCTMGEIEACSWSDAPFSRPMYSGSSELSASCFATSSTRLASRASLDVLSTIFCGCRVRIASSHRNECFCICFSDASMKSAGSFIRIRPADTSCGVRLSIWLADASKPSASFLLPPEPPAATIRPVFDARSLNACRRVDFWLKFCSRPGVPSGCATASMNCFSGVEMSIKSSTTRFTTASCICFFSPCSFSFSRRASSCAWGVWPSPLAHICEKSCASCSTSSHSWAISAFWCPPSPSATRRPSSTMRAIARTPSPRSSRAGFCNHRHACSSRPCTVCAVCCRPALSTPMIAFSTDCSRLPSLSRMSRAMWSACGVVPFPSCRKSHSVFAMAVMSPASLRRMCESCGRHRSATFSPFSTICRSAFSPTPPRSAYGLRNHSLAASSLLLIALWIFFSTVRLSSSLWSSSYVVSCSTHQYRREDLQLLETPHEDLAVHLSSTRLHSRTILRTSDSSKHRSSEEVPCRMPREPSISFLRAGPEKGSERSMRDASSSSWAAVSTRVNDDGMSCFRMSSSECCMVSCPTRTRFVTASETACTGRSRSGIALPSSASSWSITNRETYE